MVPTKSKFISAWQLARNDFLFVVIGRENDHKLLYVESPEESGFLSPQRESLIRVFNSKEEAEWYGDTIKEYLGETMYVTKITLEDLFSVAIQINERISKIHESTLRIDFCRVSSPSEFAKEIDTIWSPLMLAN